MGWVFDKAWGIEGLVEAVDHLNGCQTVCDLYKMVDPDFDGNATLPILWDKQTGTIVNNESSEIIRMLNDEFNEFATNKELNLFPEAHGAEIAELAEWIDRDVNDGVYKSGFAQN